MTWLIIPSLSLSFSCAYTSENIRLAARGNQIYVRRWRPTPRKMGRQKFSAKTTGVAKKKSRARSPPRRAACVYRSPIKLLRVGTFNSHLEVKLKLEIPNVLRRASRRLAWRAQWKPYNSPRAGPWWDASAYASASARSTTRETPLFRTLTHVRAQIRCRLRFLGESGKTPIQSRANSIPPLLIIQIETRTHRESPNAIFAKKLSSSVCAKSQEQQSMPRVKQHELMVNQNLIRCGLIILMPLKASWSLAETFSRPVKTTTLVKVWLNVGQFLKLWHFHLILNYTS